MPTLIWYCQEHKENANVPNKTVIAYKNNRGHDNGLCYMHNDCYKCIYMNSTVLMSTNYSWNMKPYFTAVHSKLPTENRGVVHCSMSKIIFSDTFKKYICLGVYAITIYILQWNTEQHLFGMTSD